MISHLSMAQLDEWILLGEKVMSNTTIKCQNCGTQIEEKFKQQHLLEQKKLQDEIEAKRKEYKTHLDQLKAKEEALLEEKEKFDEQLRKATNALLKQERNKLYDEIKKELTLEQSESVALLQKEIAQKSAQVQELGAAKIMIEQLKREKEEAAMAAKLEAQKSLNEELRLEKEKLSKLAEEERARIAKQVAEENELKLKAKDEQMEQLKRSLEDAKRKAEQGSMQVQGEALELTIESWLSTQFPFDTIEEVKKGAFGAD